ncbi:hypothetical protein ABT075_00675 [Streptomyces sp. NPDC002677]|uniref:hypothetical protein n=1 Tax=Streptomyces sp. NPDC002677 TaxID=3154774 RepID=UPI00332F5E86
MRKLAIGAALSGALALAGLAAPAASAAPSTPDLKFTDITVNNGKAIVVGTTKSVSVPVTYTLTRPVDVDVNDDSSFAGVILYRGTLKSLQNIVGPDDDLPTCTTTATTDTTVTASCSEKIVIDPEDGLFEAADATTWKAGGFYSYFDSTVSDDFIGSNLASAIWGNLGTAKVQRAARLTADASPEPVAKGKTITVKGKLTRADWDAAAYKGYQGQKAVLQFRPEGGKTYTNVKGITSGTGGALSTTVKASKSGYYRYVFAGTTTTAAATATGDFIKVK